MIRALARVATATLVVPFPLGVLLRHATNAAEVRSS